MRQTIGNRNVIVFDGQCVLCKGFFQYVLRQDKAFLFHFATAQSGIGQSLYEALDLPMRDFETLLVVHNGQVLQKLDAALLVFSKVTLWGRGAMMLRYLPQVLKDRIYDFVACRRFRWFGRLEVCLVPDDQTRERFL